MLSRGPDGLGVPGLYAPEEGHVRFGEDRRVGRYRPLRRSPVGHELDQVIQDLLLILCQAVRDPGKLGQPGGRFGEV